jgi:hypothetical protein
MGPKQESNFFLYDMGIHPDLLSLGSLVLGNYGIQLKFHTILTNPSSKIQAEEKASSTSNEGKIAKKRLEG